MGRKHCGKRRNCSLRAISPYPSVFKRPVLQTHKTDSLFGKELKTLRKETFENIVGKEENAGNQHFLLFLCFLPFPKQISTFVIHLFWRLQML